MKTIITLAALILILGSCSSTKKVSQEIYQQKDSSSYVAITTVELDTTRIPSDTATFDASFSFTPEGQLIIQEVAADQGSDVRIDYQVQPRPGGGATLKVKAVTSPREVVSQTITREIQSLQSTQEASAKVSEKKIVRNFNWWNLTWIIPLAAGGILLYVKRKSLLGIFA
jgi:hypothetical protein